ncbi:hypothetical protein NDU88_001296 [Pleurodeles waltl]|uniref:Uncharacterized protein n=1 Tax=Pleurodeles waltl TaxID=8319 RepID=A0AAV7WHX4_PLEWA|nr:hypothetical protein NDU88_001296 [Pleurodeles waltl]
MTLYIDISALLIVRVSAAAASPKRTGAGSEHIASAMDLAAGHAHDHPPARERDLQGPGTSGNLLFPAVSTEHPPQPQHALESHAVFLPRAPPATCRPILKANALPHPHARGATTPHCCQRRPFGPSQVPSCKMVLIVPPGGSAFSVPFCFLATLSPRDASVTGENGSRCLMPQLFSFPFVLPFACISPCVGRLAQDNLVV